MPRLTPEDSERVADAMIEAIGEARADFTSMLDAIEIKVDSILQPLDYKADWLPLLVEHALKNIRIEK